MATLYCNITGTLKRGNGTIISNERIIVKKVTLSGTVISSNHSTYRSDNNGNISFLLPQNSTAWIYGSVVGLDKYTAGTPCAVPSSLTADLSTLIDPTIDFPNVIPVLNPLPINSDNFVTTADYISHTGDSTIHFTETSLNLNKYALSSTLDSHTSDSTIHFTKSSINLNDLGDTSITSPIDDDVLKYDSVSGWINGISGGGNAGLTGIANQIAVFSGTSSATGFVGLSSNGRNIDLHPEDTIVIDNGAVWGPYAATTSTTSVQFNVVSTSGMVGEKNKYVDWLVDVNGTIFPLYESVLSTLSVGCYNDSGDVIITPKIINVGFTNVSSGNYSCSIGFQNTVTSDYSFAFGYITKANGGQSFAVNKRTTANGEASVAQGLDSEAYGIASHAEGRNTRAYGNNSHSEGQDTVASGDWTHAEGYKSVANHDSSFIWSGPSDYLHRYTVSSNAFHIFGDNGLILLDDTPLIVGGNITANSDISISGSITSNKSFVTSTAITSNNQLTTKQYVDDNMKDTIKYIKDVGSTTGDLHLTDTTWTTSFANIKYIRFDTSSTSYNVYLLQNDNGYITDDAIIPSLNIATNAFENSIFYLDHPYFDEDSTDEVHLYWESQDTGSLTANIYIVGVEAK